MFFDFKFANIDFEFEDANQLNNATRKEGIQEVSIKIIK